MNKKFLALALSAGMIFAACGNNTDTNTNETNEKAETKVEDVKDSAKDAKDSAKETKDEVETAVKTATSDIKEVKIDLDGAVNKFKETFSDEEIAIEGVSLELENGEYEYEIEGRKDNKEYSLTLDANTADIKAQNEEDDDDNETAEPIDFASIISPEEAMDKALTGQEDAKVVEWSLSTDDGKTKYEIDVENGDDKEVDALTGEVVDD
ncbi:MAG: PepSY domain-containing protein [Anaerococcus sp.]|uniref:PepSY domain-containing protein n=1 Tax=Anaerococcus sp. TaxID=1872515 RepID=UPI002615FA3E|nr:PepSY domain-containing protein [Anaerococcus sp.]MCI5972016.1 PepSY domain-containing protein [Anaerococcus sp.]MDY2927749.1 PepSY domain-containing protein [Anaerococcus sp.]